MSTIRSCKDCEDRKPGCHSTCERYNGERVAIEERRRKNLEEALRQKSVDSVLYKNRKKY